MTTKAEAWKTESGLPDDFGCLITGAQFGFLAEYQNGEVPLLIWNVESSVGDVERIGWSIGKEWTPSPDGSSVSSTKRKRFVRTRLYGRLIDRVVGGRKVDMSKYGAPSQAKVWTGLGFHMRREKIKFPGGAERGLREEIEHLMPVAFLDKKGTARRQTTPATASTPAPAQVAEEDSDIKDQLTQLAKKLSKEKFQAAALRLSEVVNDPALLNDVMNDGGDGFWAKARA